MHHGIISKEGSLNRYHKRALKQVHAQLATIMLQEVACTCSLRLGFSETQPLSHSRADEIEGATADVPACSIFTPSICGNTLQADDWTCKQTLSSQAVSRSSDREDS